MYKALDLWLPAYLRRSRHSKPAGVTHIFLAVCDHFEPLHDANKKVALERLDLWKSKWPALIRPFADADGIAPRHTFFYPVEQYDTDILNSLTELCRLSGGEVEIHLHHDKDTADGVRAKLDQGKQDLLRHNLLAKDASGKTHYGFIHGNWALDNSHPEGRGCGVRNELQVLKDTGCYGDFTMPSAPHPTQTRIINSIYYAKGSDRPKSHDSGRLAAANSPSNGGGNDLLLVQGPLGLNWQKRKFGFLPGIENADLTAANPPTAERMRLWLNLGVHVQGRQDCVFIKLHTHGAIPPNSTMFLGEPTRRFHEHLMETYRDNGSYKLHYVTAREMVNVIHGLEDQRTENFNQLRDYRYRSLLKANAA